MDISILSIASVTVNSFHCFYNSCGSCTCIFAGTEQ